ncbi:MAG: alpha/beta hydrolase [Sneathiella sp.]
MSTIVYKDYDQFGLDVEYNNQMKVADFKSYLGEWSALCATAIHEYSDIKTYCYDEASGQTLDIIYPVEWDGSPCPIQVFFHGGYWKALSKDDFTFVARAFAQYGIATAIVDYQLMPEVTIDVLVHQCQKSLAFLYTNAAELDLDSSNLHISGHSAGGHLVAMCMATDWSEFAPELPKQIIKSGVGISGLYNLLPISLCFLQKDLNLDMETVLRNSPVNFKEPSSGKLHLIVGGLEGREYLAQSDALAASWPEVALAPKVLAPYNHFSIMSSLAEPTSFLSTHIRHVMGETH